MTDWRPTAEEAQMFERYTDRARRCVLLASDRARVRHDNQVTQGDLLWGLLEEGQGVAALVLERAIKPEDILACQSTIVDVESPDYIPPSPAYKATLELALREALLLGHNYIGTEHLLLALVRATEDMPKLDPDLDDFFSAHSASDLRRRVIEQISGYERAKQTETAQGPTLSFEPTRITVERVPTEDSPLYGVHYLGSKVVDGRLMFDAADFMGIIRTRNQFADWEKTLEERYAKLVLAHADEICQTDLDPRIEKTFGSSEERAS